MWLWQVAKPAAVSRAEAAVDMGEDEVLEAITAYQLAVGQASTLVRSLLPLYSGWVASFRAAPLQPHAVAASPVRYVGSHDMLGACPLQQPRLRTLTARVPVCAAARVQV